MVKKTMIFLILNGTSGLSEEIILPAGKRLNHRKVIVFVKKKKKSSFRSSKRSTRPGPESLEVPRLPFAPFLDCYPVGEVMIE